nr:MAG TPA: hypothetical protein [Caudoviricetes sp.]
MENGVNCWKVLRALFTYSKRNKDWIISSITYIECSTTKCKVTYYLKIPISVFADKDIVYNLKKFKEK